ncbi:hypothetical protein ACFPT7_16405 [Acidicapsa dinghuensis]|uniref:DUF948 domain-containing protein n=1 Tax=Acidicapsa dinghuensis TaxID=2218256 RepID=A0ABW1EKR3_9BACT|nr:hypothetical protein [Acidicapsa dinghuensis]
MTFQSETLLIIFVGATCAAVLLQAFVLLGIFFSVRKSAKLITDATDELKTTVMPMVHSTRQLVDKIYPEVITVTDALAEFTVKARKEATQIDVSPAELINGIKRQVQRIDSMLTVGLDRVERAGNALETTVATPVRQLNGVLAAIKATVDTYRSFPGSNGNTRGGA